MTYIEDMPDKLADAHLVIGRAGASTIAELTAAGRPAILIPFPAATDDHQTANAREMAKAGGARTIQQAEFTPDELARQIEAMAADPDALANAAARALVGRAAARRARPRRPGRADRRGARADRGRAADASRRARSAAASRHERRCRA